MKIHTNSNSALKNCKPKPNSVLMTKTWHSKSTNSKSVSTSLGRMTSTTATAIKPASQGLNTD